MRSEYGAIEHLLYEAEAAKSRGDYAEYERLRRQYLNEQARIYHAQRAMEQWRRRRREVGR